MESINNSLAQLRDLFRSMTPAARVTAGLLLSAVVVSLGYLFAGGAGQAEHLLFGGEQLGPAEIHAIEAALSAEQIHYDTSGNRVRVAADRQYEAMGAIAAAGAMPMDLHNIMTKALESGSFLEGRAQTQERIEAGKERYLQEVIRAMPWVQDAAVSFEEKKGRGLREEDLVTAAVAITPVAGRSLDPLEAKKLQQFTAAWFGRGLTPEQVQVTDLHGSAGAYENDPLALAELADNEYVKNMMLVEAYVKNKIASHLRHIPGAQVEVHADLTPELTSHTRTTKFDPKGTLTQVETELETSRKAAAVPGGRTGLLAQGPDAPPPQTTPATESTTEVNRDSNNYLVGSTDQLTQQAGLTPQDMKASIQIPMDWLVETVWAKQWRRLPNNADAPEVPPPTVQELQTLIDDQRTQIQSDVENLFPDANPGEDPFPRVVVSFYEETEAAPIPEPTLAETAFAWTAAHWTTLFMFCLAAASLVMLRSMVKSANQSPAHADRATFKLELPVAASQPEEPEVEEEDRPKLRLNKGPTLKDDLAALVREDPDTAATILRSWISHAA
jgi:flagellar M-ring protein FliF